MGIDTARAHDALSAGVSAPFAESAFGTTRWTVDRWNEAQTAYAQQTLGRPILDAADFRFLGMTPYLSTALTGNLITNAGWTRLMNLLTNQGGTQALDATHARIGVGNSNTAEAYADTDLGASAGSSNRWFQLVSGAGTLGTRTLAFSATFATGDGNFAWNEFGLDFGTASGNTVTAPLFNHKAGIAQGTKASGQTWTATATITFS